jgi:hypothetical protein
VTDVAATTAARGAHRHFATIVARDWKAFAATLAPDFSMDDRRRGLRSTRDRAAMIEWVRAGADGGVDDIRIEILETRGENVVLGRVIATARETEFVIESLAVLRTDPEGRIVAGVQLDADELPAARGALDDAARDET